MRVIRFFDKEHNCQVKKEHNLFARRMGSGLTEVEDKSRNELWLFCPWCGEKLAEFVEAEEKADWIHIYETSSDSDKSIPARDEHFTLNCGQTLLIEHVLYNKTDFEQSEICPECLLQRKLFPPKFRFFLRGSIEKLAPATP